MLHVSTAATTTGLIAVLAIAGRVALGSGDRAVTPAGRFSLKGIFELLTEMIVGLAEMVIGEAGKKYVPMFAAIFTYVWFNNLLGLVPGMTPATDNINTTLALGVFSFVMYNALGFREHGFGYLKQFMGPLIYIAPLMLIIELISHVIRPLTLGLRLAGNITADHAVLSIFLEMVPAGVPAIFYGMGLFVATIQAFVFTLLSMIYVSLAISHDH
jgi:F-type H+-transporting ATPase subunit a